jgi:hypothetical protein
MKLNPFKKHTETTHHPAYGPWIAKALTTPGGHLFIGCAGYTLFFDKGSTLTGYDCDIMKDTCIRAGLPVIDARNLSRSDAMTVAFKGPMAAVGETPHRPPYHALSMAPLAIVAAHYEAAGAEITNLLITPAELNAPPLTS